MSWFDLQKENERGRTPFVHGHVEDFDELRTKLPDFWEESKGVGNLLLTRERSKSLSSKAAGESKLEAYSLGSTVRRIRTTKSVLAPEW